MSKINITESELRTLVVTIIESVIKKQNINEIFGFSEKEKSLKQLKSKILQAFEEINNFNFNRLFYQPGTGNAKEMTQKGLEIRVRQAGDELPIFKELVPELFEKETRGILVKYKLSETEIIDGLIPDTFGSIYDNSHIISNETGKYYAKLELHKKYPNIVKYFNGKFIMDNKYLN